MLTVEKDIDKIKKMLEDAGMEIIPESTVEVPFFSAGVVCGNPSMIGDETYETIAIPKEFVKLGCTYVVEARGNSMTGANIFDGDKLAIRAGADANSGDIVVAFIGDGATVKVYFEDENGVRWLLPQNDMFEPIRLDEDMGARIMGVVVGIERNHPRVEYNECVRTLRNATRNSSDKPVTAATNFNDPIITLLMPMFFNEKAEVVKFLSHIKGAKPTEITATVTRLAKEGKVSKMSCKRDLWTILHDAGLYPNKENTWNKQVILC